MINWKEDKKWADGYFPEIKQIIKSKAGEIVDIVVASDEKDKSYATDYIIKIEKSGDIACRVRKPNCRYRELTLRYSRPSGIETEFSKIKGGYASWYLYAWATNGSVFGDWIFINLDKLRQSGLLNEKWSIVPNWDNSSSFIGIPFFRLYDVGCVVDFKATTWLGKQLIHIRNGKKDLNILDYT